MEKKVANTKYDGMSISEKRDLVLAEGVRIKQFVCPLCGLNRVLDRNEKGRIRFDNVDLESGLILQERAGGGRGSGFYMDRSMSLTLPELKGDSDYQDLLEQIKSVCRGILQVLE